MGMCTMWCHRSCSSNKHMRSPTPLAATMVWVTLSQPYQRSRSNQHAFSANGPVALSGSHDLTFPPPSLPPCMYVCMYACMYVRLYCSIIVRTFFFCEVVKNQTRRRGGHSSLTLTRNK